jgi:hypothetical protein
MKTVERKVKSESAESNLESQTCKEAFHGSEHEIFRRSGVVTCDLPGELIPET